MQQKTHAKKLILTIQRMCQVKGKVPKNWKIKCKKYIDKEATMLTVLKNK